MRHEQVYIQLGGVPFAAEIRQDITLHKGDLIEADSAAVKLSGAEFAVLLESVGKEKDFDVNDLATLWFKKGQVIVCEWTGERHVTDSRRLMKPFGGIGA
jgi:hypothetical protein